MYQIVFGIALAVVVAVAVIWMVAEVLVAHDSAAQTSISNISYARRVATNRSFLVIQQ